jgi:hypothetical protein
MAHACGDLKSSPKAILFYMALRYNEKKGCTWVSIGDMAHAHACSMSPATVKRALRVLADSRDGQNLITRSLRDERVTKSRKTVIHWDKVAARATQFRPPIAQKPVSVPAADAATIAEDLATIESFSGGDAGSQSSFESSPRVSLYDRWDEAVTLVKQTFRSHPTFQDGDGVVRACLHNCFDIAGSGDKYLEVLTWICTAPANESIRKAVLRSEVLGGYLRGAFKDWVAKFDVTRKGQKPNAPESSGDESDEMDQVLREGYARFHYREGGSQADIRARERLLAQLGAEVGSANVHYYDLPDDCFAIDVAEHACVAYLLSQHCGLPVGRAQFKSVHCDGNLVKLCAWAIEDNRWAEGVSEAMWGPPDGDGEVRDGNHQTAC